MDTKTGPFDAVVFDLLTALLDSWSLWNRIAGSDEAGLKWRMEYLRLTYGAGAYRDYGQLVTEAAADAGMVDADKLSAQLIAAFGDVAPWDDMANTLSALKDAPFPPNLAIATNCSDALAAKAVATLGFDFDVVVSAETAGHYKPRPEVYEKVLAELGTAPERTLFVAGSAADVPGAKACGMPVYWHNRLGLAPFPNAPEADWQYDSLAPLANLFHTTT